MLRLLSRGFPGVLRVVPRVAARVGWNARGALLYAGAPKSHWRSVVVGEAHFGGSLLSGSNSLASWRSAGEKKRAGFASEQVLACSRAADASGRRNRALANQRHVRCITAHCPSDACASPDDEMSLPL